MKHFRPIKTFATWLLEEVRVSFPDAPSLSGGDHADEWIQANLNLHRSSYGDLRANIYSHSYSGFPSSGQSCINIFNFPDAASADAFHAEFGGERLTIDESQSARRNESLSGHFTMDDLKKMYGDPLPNIVQYHLVDMEDRLSGYFYEFKHMHQPWARNWLPSAFVYVNDRDLDTSNEILNWFHTTLFHQITEEDPHGWQRGWQSNANDVYEFDDPSVAALFKLRFGGNGVPERRSLSRNSTIVTLKDHVNIVKRANGYCWERDPSVPDYRIAIDPSKSPNEHL